MARVHPDRRRTVQHYSIASRRPRCADCWLDGWPARTRKPTVCYLVLNNAGFKRSVVFSLCASYAVSLLG